MLGSLIVMSVVAWVIGCYFTLPILIITSLIGLVIVLFFVDDIPGLGTKQENYLRGCIIYSMIIMWITYYFTGGDIFVQGYFNEYIRPFIFRN
jgi:hypothetical protein